MQSKPPKSRLAGGRLCIDFKISRLRGKLRAGRGSAQHLHIAHHALKLMMNMPMNQRARTGVFVEHSEQFGSVGQVDRVHPLRAGAQRIMVNTQKYILTHGVCRGKLTLEPPKAFGIERALLGT